jgi:iron(II)-dependent oxidoreductase
MVLQHEYQHNETILQTMQLKQGMPYRAPRAYPVPQVRTHIQPEKTVRFTGGRVWLGTNDRSVSYDNERPVHELDVAPFSIDVFPVTNGQFRQFMRDGGYTRSELWSAEGWEWVSEAKVDSPKHWVRRRRLGAFDNGRRLSRSIKSSVCHVLSRGRRVRTMREAPD